MLHQLRGPSSATVVALLGWVALVAGTIAWGDTIWPADGPGALVHPFHARYRLAVAQVLPAAAYAAGLVVLLPAAAARLRWRPLLASCVGLAVGWAVLLNAWDGHRGLGSVFIRSTEYLAGLTVVGDDPRAFLVSFSERVAARELPVHVNGHPPLMLLVFWVWDRIGLSGPGWAAALVIGAGASAVAAIALTVRAVAGDVPARTVLPFLVLGPFALTVATSADSFFLGVGAWGVAALAWGVRRGSASLLLVAGLLLGSLPYLSYGLLPLGAVAVAAAWLARGRGARPGAGGLTALVTGLVAVPVAMTWAGFSWFDGASATHTAWVLGGGDDRPYVFSVVGDLAVLAVLVGPATVVAAARRPSARPGLLALGAAVALLVLALSGVTRLEVERIWLPFAPWLVVLCSGLARSPRRWLALNALCALVFQALLLDGW